MSDVPQPAGQMTVYPEPEIVRDWGDHEPLVFDATIGGAPVCRGQVTSISISKVVARCEDENCIGHCLANEYLRIEVGIAPPKEAI